MNTAEQISTSPGIIYKTTRPVVPLMTDRSTIDIPITNDLAVQLRSFQAADIEFSHRLRTQAVVMAQTSKGCIDSTIAESQQWMDRFMPPNDDKTYNFMIWIQDGQNSWEHIGCMGSHIMRPVPHIGYMIRSEWWGKGIVTKTVQAFLKHWWTLPRSTIDISIDDFDDEDDRHFIELETGRDETGSHPDGIVPEVILAEIEHNNIGSIRVVTKSGFEYRGERKILERGQEFTLLEYTQSRPDS